MSVPASLPRSAERTPSAAARGHDGRPPRTPSLYDVRVDHVRVEPVHSAFRYGGYQWLIDLAAVPVLPRGLGALARFDPRDHFDGDGPSIRAELDTFLATRRVDLAGGRVVLLTQARVCGYVFNPLSVFWCYGRDGALVCVVAEVHNTYGQRHAYLLRTDERGRAETAKEFYVSPFYPVEGSYRMSLPEPGERLDLTITLHRDAASPFVARLHGRRRDATPAALISAALRHPAAPLVGAARIRRQGIGLWLRGLRPAPRPDHQQKGVS